MGSGHNFDANPLKNALEVDWKSGKLEGTGLKMWRDGRTTPADMAYGFSYYDREQRQRSPFNERFTAYILGMYFGVHSAGAEKGDLVYRSNLVTDTRTDILEVATFVNGERRVECYGGYRDTIKPHMEEIGRGVPSPYTKYLVAYIPERKEVCIFKLSVTLEAALIKARAKAYEMPEHKASLFGMNDLSTECWVFIFEGGVEPVVLSGKYDKNVGRTVPAPEESKTILFQPVFRAGAISSQNKEYADRVARLGEMSKEVSDYILSEQNYLLAKYTNKQAQPAAPSNVVHVDHPSPFPDRIAEFADADLQNFEAGAEPGDDLPF